MGRAHPGVGSEGNASPTATDSAEHARRFCEATTSMTTSTSPVTNAAATSMYELKASTHASKPVGDEWCECVIRKQPQKEAGILWIQTRTRRHTNTQTHAHTHTFSHTLLTSSHTLLTHSRSLSLTHAHTHSHTHTHTHTLSPDEPRTGPLWVQWRHL